ncbi:ATP-grasp domain-containing protein [Streptomyces sp. NPDC086776]|uniref:ATP-grasp domain-containing protein n=1 Tax=Streptomyces sp. NPDC086776 TaxID=3365756 RepID=UPI00380CDFAA
MAPRTRILVTGVGGAPGLDLARHLMRMGCEIIAADADPLAAGLLLDGVTPHVLPLAADPDYSQRLLDLCRDARPDALMSTVEHELPRLSGLLDDLYALRVRTWLPEIETLNACIDKARFHAVLRSKGVPTPTTVPPKDLDRMPSGSPLVVKPRRGQGTQNVYYCDSRRQARVLCELVPDPIVQERITGREFTADCLVDRSGRASTVLRHRDLVKAGLSVVSSTFHDDQVDTQVRRTLAAIGATGPCCVQGFICDEDPGVIVTEVNARFAGGFPLSEVAGAALVEQTLNGLFELPIDHDRLTYKPGVFLTKYFETLATGEQLRVAIPNPKTSSASAREGLSDVPHTDRSH